MFTANQLLSTRSRDFNSQKVCVFLDRFSMFFVPRANRLIFFFLIKLIDAEKTKTEYKEHVFDLSLAEICLR